MKLYRNINTKELAYRTVSEDNYTLVADTSVSIPPRFIENSTEWQESLYPDYIKVTGTLLIPIFKVGQIYPVHSSGYLLDDNGSPLLAKGVYLQDLPIDYIPVTEEAYRKQSTAVTIIEYKCTRCIYELNESTGLFANKTCVYPTRFFERNPSIYRINAIRLNDGTVCRIGDDTRYGKITKFRDGSELGYFETQNPGLYVLSPNVVKPVFTTTDGVKRFIGQHYCVLDKNGNLSLNKVDKDDPCCITFSIHTAADKILRKAMHLLIEMNSMMAEELISEAVSSLKSDQKNS